ncbi:MAG: signal peptidase II [Chloroflexia bacterium]|nr:signal peptidase II [Chloroflexia bacterium]
MESDSPLDFEHPQVVERDAGPVEWRRIAGILATIVFGVALFDQIVKTAIIAWIGPDRPFQRWELAGRLVAFEYVENTGAAFGVFAGRVWLLSVLAVVVALAFLVLFWRDLPRSTLLRTSVGLVLGGAIGNLLDRVRLGYVVDFMAVGVWPKFNIADSAITIGLALLVFSAFQDSPPRENTS